MHYHDPRRPRLGNGLPAWTTAPQVALPRLYLLPTSQYVEGYDGDCLWSMEIMINGSYKTITADLSCIRHYMQEWLDSPEGFVLEKFGITELSGQYHDAPDKPIAADPTSLGI